MHESMYNAIQLWSQGKETVISGRRSSFVNWSSLTFKDIRGHVFGIVFAEHNWDRLTLAILAHSLQVILYRKNLRHYSTKFSQTSNLNKQLKYLCVRFVANANAYFAIQISYL